MTDLQLYKKINSLPEDIKQEVTDFVKLLIHKINPKNKIKQRKFGYAKGFFKMSPEFNAPLKDFKEYR